MIDIKCILSYKKDKYNNTYKGLCYAQKKMTIKEKQKKIKGGDKNA
jgi:hypothetical protein